MQQRELGKNGLKVPAMGLGCMTMTPIYGVPDDERHMLVAGNAMRLYGVD